MNTEKLSKQLEEISARIEREGSSKAFIANSVVMEWRGQIELLKTQINECGEESRLPTIEESNTPKKYEENGFEFCVTCNQKVSLRRRRIEKTMITALLKAIHYCNAKGVRSFHKCDVKTMTGAEYNMLTYLVKFGLLFKSKDMIPGEFGIPFKICAEFFKGERSVLEYYEIDPTKKEGEEGFKTNSESRVFFKDIKSHSELTAAFPHTLEYLSNNSF